MEVICELWLLQAVKTAFHKKKHGVDKKDLFLSFMS